MNVPYDFNEWWKQFCVLAADAEFELEEMDKELFKEYYDDGDSPEDALDIEIDAYEQIMRATKQ